MSEPIYLFMDASKSRGSNALTLQYEFTRLSISLSWLKLFFLFERKKNMGWRTRRLTLKWGKIYKQKLKHCKLDKYNPPICYIFFGGEGTRIPILETVIPSRLQDSIRPQKKIEARSWIGGLV